MANPIITVWRPIAQSELVQTRPSVLRGAGVSKTSEPVVKRTSVFDHFFFSIKSIKKFQGLADTPISKKVQAPARSKRVLDVARLEFKAHVTRQIMKP